MPKTMWLVMFVIMVIVGVLVFTSPVWSHI